MTNERSDEDSEENQQTDNTPETRGDPEERDHTAGSESEGDGEGTHQGGSARGISRTSRRALLGTSVAGALSMTAGCMNILQNDGSSSFAENLQQSDYASHDHSGQYGAPAELGTESPLAGITVDELTVENPIQQLSVEELTAGSLNASDMTVENPIQQLAVKELVTESTPLINVAAFGVEGDGETDDADALQEALNAAVPHGTLYIPPDYEVRIEKTISADFDVEDQLRDTLDRFKFICEGVLTPADGIGTAIELKNAVGPYVFVNVFDGGKSVEEDSLFHITGGRDGLFEGFGYAYNGRIFHFEETGTYSIGHLKTFKCGQALAVFDASPMGEIRDIFEISPTRAPEFHDSTDICINQYENFQQRSITEQGVFFEDCLSVFIDRLLVGGEAETPPVEFHDCDNMFVNAMHIGGFPELGGLFENVRHSTFRIVCNVGSRGIRYTGEDSDANRFIINVTNTDDLGVIIDESISGGYHYFAGNIANQNPLAFDIRTADAEIHLDNVYAVGNRRGDLSVVEDNEVHLTNCRIESIDGTPKTINGVGVARTPLEPPDPSNWPVGTHVIFEGSGGTDGGLYLITGEDQWVRYGDIEFSGLPN